MAFAFWREGPQVGLASKRNQEQHPNKAKLLKNRFDFFGLFHQKIKISRCYSFLPRLTFGTTMTCWLLTASWNQEACLPDLITFSSAICERTPWPHAVQVLQQMEEVAVQPSAVTCLGGQRKGPPVFVGGKRGYIYNPVF